MIELLPRIPKYQMARMFHQTPPLPINYTLGLTYKCQARCLTCRIYDHPRVEEMTPGEWEKVFQGLSNSPYWVTFTGGEPFLYADLCEVYWLLISKCKPKIVNIPTNGQMVDRISRWVWDMAKMSPETKLIVNVSIDHHVPEENDKIRGLGGYTEKALGTLKILNALAETVDNLEIGIHTVLSRFNIGQFQEIHKYLPYLIPKRRNYITEIAEKRVELNTVKLNITPYNWQYREVIKLLVNGRRNGIKQAFRGEYYQNVNRLLAGESNKIPTCYAGYTSCQITPDGEVWACCIKADSMGSLRENDYQFQEIWRSEKARDVRKDTENCACPMANVSYTNILMSLPSLFRIARRI